MNLNGLSDFLLHRPGIFNLFNRLIGVNKCRALMASRYICAQPGDRILDIGCGTADILHYLPAVNYTGFDLNPRYVKVAQRRFGSRGRFFCNDLRLETLHNEGSFDRVLALGVLHHLTDEEAIQLLKLARVVLKPGGQLVTFDGCYLKTQSFMARCLLASDRGAYVRTPDGFLALARQVFPTAEKTLHEDLLSIPYTHIIMRCSA